MDCMLFTIKNRVPLMRQETSVVLHLSFFYTEYASWGLVLFSVDFNFLQLVLSYCVAVLNCRPYYIIMLLYLSVPKE